MNILSIPVLTYLLCLLVISLHMVFLLDGLVGVDGMHMNKSEMEWKWNGTAVNCIITNELDLGYTHAFQWHTVMND